jgi:hypothetical protein
MVTLGQKYTDRITGFKGVAVVRSTWLNGCINVGLEPPAKGGKLEDIQYFDEQRLVGKSPARAGGPQRSTPHQRR